MSELAKRDQQREMIQAFLGQMNEVDLSPWRIWTDESGIVHAVREAEPRLYVIKIA